jgi:ribosomal protein S18 acetylase RimI-like enzyme
MPEIIIAHNAEHFDAAKQLFTNYAAWLNIDLCFQGFDEEMKQLSEMYAAPIGALFLLKQDENYIGCVGIRQKRENAAELKRMYVQPQYQRKGFGDLLLQHAIQGAIQLGYKKIWLDTLNHMTPAITLYKKYGFVEIAPYYHNPIEGAVYFEKQL